MHLKILAIDDERDLLRFLELIFKQSMPDAAFIGATDGEAGIAMAREHRPNIILLDARMPGLDGFEACRRLKKDPETSGIPILMISGVMLAAEHRVLGMDMGAEGYLCKPFEPMELLSQVNCILRADHEAQRRREEAASARIQKLDALGLLAGGIARDFNNLLTGIIGNLSFMQSHAGHASSGDALQEAMVAAEKTQALAQQLMTFSRGGAPVRRPEKPAVLLQSLVDAVFEDDPGMARTEITEPIPHVCLDAIQLGRAIESVLVNAREATPPGGKVDIRCEAIQLPDVSGLATGLKPGLHVRITIRDQGPGIPADVLLRVFEPFFTTKAHALGLGLAIAYSVIRQHEGDISIISAPGGGAVVTILLPASSMIRTLPDPVTPGLQGGKPKPALSSSRGEPKRILVMDDEDLIRRMLTRLLQSQGYAVDTTVRGEDAVQKYVEGRRSGRPYDAVILDLTVPAGLNGIETMKELQKMDPRVRAIVSSGYSADPVMADYRRYGFVGVVRKPYDMKELAETLRDILG